MRSVPLEEEMVTWIGEKELQTMNVSTFLDSGSFRVLGRVRS